MQLINGSNLYYSLLFTPKAKQNNLMDIYEFYRTLNSIIINHKEPKIAETKIAWWHQEIYKIFAGNPQHPIGKNLAKLLSIYNLQQASFEQLIQGLYLNLSRPVFTSFAELKSYSHLTIAPLLQIINIILGSQENLPPAYSQNLAIAINILQSIRSLGKHARAGKIYIPIDDLNKHNINLQDLLALNIKDYAALKDLLAQQFLLAKQYYCLAIKNLPKNYQRLQSPGLILAKIYLTTCQEILNSKENILQYQFELTAIRKFWLAITTHFFNSLYP